MTLRELRKCGGRDAPQEARREKISGAASNSDGPRLLPLRGRCADVDLLLLDVVRFDEEVSAAASRPVQPAVGSGGAVFSSTAVEGVQSVSRLWTTRCLRGRRRGGDRGARQAKLVTGAAVYDGGRAWRRSRSGSERRSWTAGFLRGRGYGRGAGTKYADDEARRERQSGPEDGTREHESREEDEAECRRRGAVAGRRLERWRGRHGTSDDRATVPSSAYSWKPSQRREGGHAGPAGSPG